MYCSVVSIVIFKQTSSSRAKVLWKHLVLKVNFEMSEIMAEKLDKILINIQFWEIKRVKAETKYILLIKCQSFAMSLCSCMCIQMCHYSEKSRYI